MSDVKTQSGGFALSDHTLPLYTVVLLEAKPCKHAGHKRIISFTAVKNQ